MKDSELLDDLTLTLMYLTRFKMNKISQLNSSWKGYDFAVIDSLDEKNYIYRGKNSNKSVTLTEEGEKKAVEILEKLKNIYK